VAAAATATRATAADMEALFRKHADDTELSMRLVIIL
jgi:hypothetical protein